VTFFVVVAGVVAEGSSTVVMLQSFRGGTTVVHLIDDLTKNSVKTRDRHAAGLLHDWTGTARRRQGW
jgi:hypothetical protein